MQAIFLWITLLIYSRFKSTCSEFTFANSRQASSSSRTLYHSSPTSYSHSYNNYENDEQPSSKHIHKIKKLRKKQLLLCLLGSGNGRDVPLDSSEVRFLLPSVIQQTEVNVGGSPTGSNHLSSPGSYGGGLSNCDQLMGSGGIGGLGHPLLSHPLLSSLGSALGGGGGGGGSGNKPAPVDEDQNRFNHNLNVNRQIIRPLYKSMKAFYRLF